MNKMIYMFLILLSPLANAADVVQMTALQQKNLGVKVAKLQVANQAVGELP